VAGTEYSDSENYCSPTASYEVRSVDATGATSAPATATADDPDVDCTARPEVLSAVPGADGSVAVELECHSTGNGNFRKGELSLLVDGEVYLSDGQCRGGGSADRDVRTFTVTGLAPASTHTVQGRTVGVTGTKTSPAVTVTLP
jgi:hypothetical protein